MDTMTMEEAADLDAVIIINAHDVFKSISLDQLKAVMRTPVLVDIKELYDRAAAEQAGFTYLSL